MAAASRGWFANLSVRLKILTAIGVAAAVALAVGVTGLVALSNASAMAQRIYSNNVASVTAIAQIRGSFYQARIDLANQAVSQDAPTVAKYTDSFLQDLSNFEAAVAAYRGTGPAGEPKLIDELMSKYRTWVQIARTKQLVAGAANDMCPGRPPGTPRSHHCSRR
ncbi:Tar ligand binding domain-containing protein [Dactylosporangium sp. McL0621]|uniref:Tar ligand binding domain-containing protein n=1 Tax=Dactylosporangium sp. McL0621 TaxID=3415678 RepID=UPI003CF5F952